MALRKVAAPAKAAVKAEPPKISSQVKVYDVLYENLIASTDNPNEQDDSTFDQMVQGIKEDGFDEPIIVVPQIGVDGKTETGKYIIVSGHHRAKAGKVAGMEAIPSIIKEGWEDDKRKVELVRRNMLRGTINAEKFTKLFSDMIKRGYDAAVLQKMMGFTKKEAFEKLFKGVANSLPAKERKKLEEAKETIKSVDDLSSVLNRIFRESGSEMDHGYMVFSFGGKQHHYFKIDEGVHKQLKALEENISKKGLTAVEVFRELLKSADTGVTKKRLLKRPLNASATAAAKEATPA